jgi:hypothetical protein
MNYSFYFMVINSGVTYMQTNLPGILNSAFGKLFILIYISLLSVQAQTLKPAYDSPLDGQINSVMVSNNKVYMGGTFTTIGYSCGTGVLIDTNLATPIRTFPKIDPMGGEVLASVPDSNGGLYIGGQFTYVNGVPRKFLAHILANNSLDPWNPSPNSSVNSLTIYNHKLYVGGLFDTIAGQLRGKGAAFETVTGTLLNWNPKANNSITAIQPTDSIVYIGGTFTALNSVVSYGIIAATDSTTGNATSWLPYNIGPNNTWCIYQFLLTDKYIYACGAFDVINNVTRNGIFKMDLKGNVITGWDPGATLTGGIYMVHSLAQCGDKIIAGGSFTGIGGQTVSNLAAIDTGTGIASATWLPNPNNYVYTLLPVGNKLFVGGLFTSIGGKTVTSLAAIDINSGNAYDWDAKLFNINGNNIYPWALAYFNGALFAGGDFVAIGHTIRNRLAAVDLATGCLTSWNPNISQSGTNVYSLVRAGNKIFAGGSFTQVGGSPTFCLAALDTLNGTPILSPTWNGLATGTVRTLLVLGNRLYVGGDFTSINSTSRTYLAALNLSDGSLLSWNPVLTGWSVYSLTSCGSKVFASGYFTAINSQARNYAAAFDTTTGLLTQWNPNPDNICQAMASQGTTVYLGGQFNNLGSTTCKSLAAVDTATGALISGFNANFTLAYLVDAIAVGGNNIIIGGNFSTINGQTRVALALLDAATGALNSWSPCINNNNSGNVYSIAVSPQVIAAGGWYAASSYFPQINLSIINDPDIVLPVEITTFSAKQSGGKVILDWVTATELNNSGFEIERKSGTGTWVTLGTVAGHGNSAILNKYSYTDNNPTEGQTFSYRLKQMDNNGSFRYSNTIMVSLDLPVEFRLLQNSPNPFNPSTIINYAVPADGNVKLSVYNIKGELIRTVVNGFRKAGYYSAAFDGTGLSSGIYFYKIDAGKYSQTRKMILIK